MLRRYSVSCVLVWLEVMLATLCFFGISHSSELNVQMRVVKETANWGNQRDFDSVNHLIPLATPSNFSGPKLLKKLVGKCFNSTDERYRYTFCPFQNFLQYEMSQRWNAYQGVLGVWSHWELKNNTFAAMVHTHGDSCGDIKRSVRILIKCGEKDMLGNVSEPNQCQYLTTFQTKYACHPDALLIYPRLPKPLQKDWDLLATELHYNYITEKGYEKGLQEVFYKAGFAAPTQMPDLNQIPKTASNILFDNLQLCNQEYKSLQSEITRLKSELDALKVIIDLRNVQNRALIPNR